MMLHANVGAPIYFNFEVIMQCKRIISSVTGDLASSLSLVLRSCFAAQNEPWASPVVTTLR